MYWLGGRRGVQAARLQSARVCLLPHCHSFQCPRPLQNPAPARRLLCQSGLAAPLLAALARALGACSEVSTTASRAEGEDTASGVGELEGPLLLALLALSHHPSTCDQLLAAGVLPVAAALLRRHAPATAARGACGQDCWGGLLPPALELLWNVLEGGAPEAVGEALQRPVPPLPEGQAQDGNGAECSPSGAPAAAAVTGAVGHLLEPLLRCVEHRQARELCNDAAAVLERLCRFPEAAAALAASGLIHAVAAAGAAPVGPRRGAAGASSSGGGGTSVSSPGAASVASHGGCNRDELDVELKLLLWSAAAEAAAADTACAEVLLLGGAAAVATAAAGTALCGGGRDLTRASWLAALLAHAESGPVPSPLAGQLAGLAPEQRAALRRGAWLALLRAAPLAPGAVLACGADVLIGALGTAAAAAAAGAAAAAHGSTANGPATLRPWSREGAGGVAPELPARLVMRLCRSRAAGGGPQAAAALVQAGAVPVLLALLPQGGSAAQGVDQQGDAARQAALCALTALCEAGGAECCRAVRRARGTAALLLELERCAAGWVAGAAPAECSQCRPPFLAALLLPKAAPLRPLPTGPAPAGCVSRTPLCRRWARWPRWARCGAACCPMRARGRSSWRATASTRWRSCWRSATLTTGACELPWGSYLLLPGGSRQSSPGPAAPAVGSAASPPRCCPPRRRPLLLSVLSDLLQDARAAPFLLEWRSPRDRAETLPQLLLGVWRGAAAAAGAADARGVLRDAGRPLGCSALDTPAGAQASGGGGPSAALATTAGPSGWHAKSAAVYGYLQPERRWQLERIAAVGNPGALMDKVYACLAAAGFNAVSLLLGPADAAALAAVRAHVPLRQAGVWRDIRGAFDAEGLAPSDEDRWAAPGRCRAGSVGGVPAR
jgi:hypothetical protein